MLNKTTPAPRGGERAFAPKSIRFWAAAIGGATLLLACASTPTPYQPRDAAHRYGYGETPIEANRMRVSFSGNAQTDRETVEAYLLYRAAEATLERGFDYFVIVRSDVEKQVSFKATGARPRLGATHYQEVSQHEAAADIAMYRGQKPPLVSNAYDARGVQTTLQSRIRRASAG